MKGGNKWNKGIKLNEIELSADFLVGSPRFLCGLSGFLMSTSFDCVQLMQACKQFK